MSDADVAAGIKLRAIAEVAAKLDIPADALEPYGKAKAKLSSEYLETLAGAPTG